MALNIGIIGLPQSGKTSLFNALTKAGAPISGYATSTVQANLAVVQVPDARLQPLADIFHPKKVTHVALVARNFEAMFDFYVNSVGLTALVGDRDSDLALLKGTASDGDVTLYRAGAGVSPGLHHVGFEVWDEDDLERSIAALPNAGVRVEKQIDHPARRSIVIKDPDGLRLQFFVNRDWSAPVIGSASREEALYLL